MHRFVYVSVQCIFSAIADKGSDFHYHWSNYPFYQSAEWNRRSTKGAHSTIPWELIVTLPIRQTSSNMKLSSRIVTLTKWLGRLKKVFSRKKNLEISTDCERLAQPVFLPKFTYIPFSKRKITKSLVLKYLLRYTKCTI